MSNFDLLLWAGTRLGLWILLSAIPLNMVINLDCEDLTEEQKQEIFDTVIFEAPYSVKCFDDAVMALSEQKFDRIVEELAEEFAEC